MTPQDLKKSILRNCKSCRDAICNAALKISDTTKVPLRDWRRNQILICTLAVISVAVLGNQLAGGHCGLQFYYDQQPECDRRNMA